MTILADDLGNEFGADAKLTEFPSGGAMLDVRHNSKLFVMACSPTKGFGVDRVEEDDGFVSAYAHAFSTFSPAAEQLRGLITDSPVNGVELNLLVIYSKRIHEAKTFYDRPGLSFQMEQHGKGPEHYAAEIGSIVFEIYPYSESGNGVTRLGFRVPSVDRALEGLRQQYEQLNILSGPEDSPWGRRAVVKDLDGNRVELTEEVS
jgi:lactoylglutathione lyase